MTDSTNDLNFSDYNSGKVVGTHTYVSSGNGLLNKSATEIIIPERYLGVKVTEIGYNAFRGTNIVSIFIPIYVKTIMNGALWACYSLKYITFDANSELETTDYLLSNSLVESINIPASLKTYKKTDYTFANNKKLSCVSYLGSTDLSYSDFIVNPSSSIVTHAMEGYSYKIGQYSPLTDGQKCPEKTFSIQAKKLSRICTCNIRRNRIPLNSVITFLITS